MQKINVSDVNSLSNEKLVKIYEQYLPQLNIICPICKNKQFIKVFGIDKKEGKYQIILECRNNFHKIHVLFSIYEANWQLYYILKQSEEIQNETTKS